MAVQWNFFLTKVISVFGEGGFAIAHRSWNTCDGTLCDRHYTRNDAELVLSGGGRFMFSNRVGATVRVGFPMITAGINFLL